MGFAPSQSVDCRCNALAIAFDLGDLAQLVGVEDHDPVAPAGSGRGRGREVDEGPPYGAVGTMEAARNSRGTVTVWGDVQGRNGNGAYAAMTRYVSVMMGTTASPEFVVVGIAGSPRERAEMVSLCRESGASQGS